MGVGVGRGGSKKVGPTLVVNVSGVGDGVGSGASSVGLRKRRSFW